MPVRLLIGYANFIYFMYFIVDIKVCIPIVLFLCYYVTYNSFIRD